VRTIVAPSGDLPGYSLEETYLAEGAGDRSRELTRAADREVLPRLSAAVRDVLPHRWAAALVAGQVSVAGPDSNTDAVAGSRPSAAELAALAEVTVPGSPSHRSVTVGGVTRQATVIVAAGPRAAGSLLVLADTPHAPRAFALVERMWELAAIMLSHADLPPVITAAERFAAGEHAKQLLMARDTHAATLTAILGPLRSRRLDDAGARQAATAIASTALTSLRATSVAQEFAAGSAFALLANQLRPLVRHTEVELEVVPPEISDRLLPVQVGEAAAAVVRGCVLVMLEHTAPQRIRVAWQVAEERLTVSVRDDGNGAVFPQYLAEYRLRERLAALGGDFTVEAVPGWGTTVIADFPLALPPSADVDVLAALSPREIEVMAELARGLSNRQIAERLRVTEHTVKFHVRRILSKLGVRSRGEAAALGRAARF
jgi:DNA-binding CsgD family transcriptional regulator